MHLTSTLVTALGPLAVVALPAPKGGGGAGFAGGGGSFGGSSGGSSGSFIGGGSMSGGYYGGQVPSSGGRGSSTGSYRGQSWSGSSFATGAFAGYLGGVYVGHGPFHGGADGKHQNDEPPADCVVAQTVNKELAPTVDCQYTWEHWHGDNFLYYLIQISPTGQEGDGWARGIQDNIKGLCGSFASTNKWYFHSQTDFGPARTVNTSTFHGLEMTVPLGKWTEGEDDKTCVAEAIRKGSCGVPLNFTTGSCYFREGTMKAPVNK